MLSFYFNKIHSLINKKSDLILNISLLLSVIYFIIRSIDCLFLIPFPIGDERVFVKEFIYLIENGFSQTIQKGTSFFYISFSFFISLITGLETFSLRIVSFISTLLLIFYFLLRISFDDLNSKKLFFTLLLFLIPTTGAAIHGTNDSMFFLFLIIFVFELIIFDKSKNNNKYLLILSSTFMIVTRPVIIVYTGSLIISLAFYSIIDRNVYLKSILKNIFQTFIIGFFIYFLISSPNFLSGNFELTNSDKSIRNGRGVTWTEWVYHSQLEGNKSRSYGLFSNMISWQDALKYKIIYGNDSLPDSYYQYLTHDFKFLIRRAMSSLIEIGVISLRYLGFLLIFFPIYIYKKVKNRDINEKTLLGIFALIGILTWAIIWPGLVQHRWLFPFYTIIIYCFSSANEKIESLFGFSLHTYNLFLINTIIIWFFWKENFFVGF